MGKFFNTRTKRILAIVAAAVLIIAAAVAAYFVISQKIKERDAAGLNNDVYKRLYILRNTSPRREKKVNEIVSLTTYYRDNGRIVKQETVSENDNKGLVIELKRTGVYELQSSECHQQATVLLTLIPKLSFVEYKIDGELYRRYQQFGEESGGKVFVAESDEKLSENVASSDAFGRFMETLRPSFESSTIDEAVGKALLAANDSKFSGGEFSGEGHRVMSVMESDGKIKAYAVTIYGQYRFINGNLVRITGTEVEPAIFTFMLSNDGKYMFEHVDFAVDGIEYDDAVKEMFVKEIAETTLQNNDSIVSEIEKQERKQAQEYLKELGRNGKTGKFSDFSYAYLSAMGVSDNVVNSITANQQLLSYPLWVGTQEFIENGKRYVYETAYAEGDTEIVFKKYGYETKETVEEVKISAADGTVTG